MSDKEIKMADRENGKIKRKTLIKLFEEDNLETVLSKLERNNNALGVNIEAYKKKIAEVETKKDDPKSYFALLLLQSRLKREEEKLNKVNDTYTRIKDIIGKYPLSSAKKPNIN